MAAGFFRTPPHRGLCWDENSKNPETRENDPELDSAIIFNQFDRKHAPYQDVVVLSNFSAVSKGRNQRTLTLTFKSVPDRFSVQVFLVNAGSTLSDLAAKQSYRLQCSHSR